MRTHNSQVIRKNATKKIKALLDSAIQIVSKVDTKDIDDSRDSHYSYSNIETVLDWLANKENYSDVHLCLVDGDHLMIRGPYHFSDKFEVFLSDEALAYWFNEFSDPIGLIENAKPAPMVLPKNVISLCEYRARQV